MERHLRVLVLSSEPPWPPTHGGARLKLYQVLKHLAPRHDMTLLMMLERPEEREFVPALEKVCGRVLAFDRKPVSAPPTWRERWQAPFYRLAYTTEVAAAIQHELTKNTYDLVHVDLAHMAVYTPLLREHRKIIAAHDSQTVSYASRVALARTPRERLRARFLLNRVRAFERQHYPEYDACIVVAEEDRDMIRRLCPDLRVQIAPNGIDLDYFQPQPATIAEPHQLVFTGMMDFGPNIDAVAWFVSAILPRVEQAYPDARFEIVGRNPTGAVRALTKSARVSATGFVPDLQPHLARAAVYVCPLRLGSGMKNKMLEAMAMGKAIVTTSEGASGIGGTSGREYLVADQAEPFADAVVELLRNPARRWDLGQAARRFVEARYSWERTVELYHQLYLAVAGRG